MVGNTLDDMSLLLFGEENFITRLKRCLEEAGLHKNIVALTPKDFSNKELHIQIGENIRRKKVYILTNFLGYGDSPEFDPNIGYMRLFIINDACRRASADEINNILPFIPYLRQDRKDKPRVPISAKLFADLVQHSGANRIVTVDMHVDQIQGFYDIPVDHFTALSVFAEEFFDPAPHNDHHLFQVDFFKIAAPIDPQKWVIVATDAGAMKRARDLKNLIHNKYRQDIHVAMLEKQRVEGKPVTHYVVGNVRHKNAIIVDDIIDTGDTLLQGIDKLAEHEVGDVYVCATHGLFSKGAEDKIKNKKLDNGSALRVIVTDSIPRNQEYLEANKHWLKMRSLAPLLTQGISRIQLGQSISELFDEIINHKN